MMSKTDAQEKPMQADLMIQNEGSIILIHPVSDAGRTFVEENIGEDNGYQPYFPTILAEPRYVGQIIDGAIDAGLRVTNGLGFYVKGNSR